MRKKIALIMWLALLGVGLGLVGLPGLARGGTIDGTDHDFSGKTWNTAQFKCQICHTPHHAGYSRLIWNHKLSSKSYTWDETTTYGGTTLPTNISTWAGSTRLCLSCHDGSVAVGDLYHDGYGSSQSVTGDAVIGGSGAMDKNHPVAIPYPYNQAQNTYNGSIKTGDGVKLTTFVGDPTTSGIRLYNDNGGKVVIGTAAGKTGMECGSCHNPHDNANDPFLRVTNTKNAICQSCHNY